jgi:hypothetical protein
MHSSFLMAWARGGNNKELARIMKTPNAKQVFRFMVLKPSCIY